VAEAEGLRVEHGTSEAGGGQAVPGLMGVIESLIDAVGRLVLWLALLMIGLVAANVVLRYLFSFGSVWAQELEWHLLAALILLGMSYALQRGDNVRVDLFYARYSPRMKFVVDVVSVLLMLLVSLLFIKLSIPYVGQSFSINETSPDPGGIPWRCAVKSLIPLGYALVVLQSVGALLRLFHERRKAISGAVNAAGEDGHV
jgi:TRAP-type mannitol/chloroaromatic compound transport system permease small subunit